MRYSRKCPKCESHDIVEVIGTKLNQHHRIPLSKWSVKNAVIDRYICCHCGYTEEFAQLTNSFKKWADKKLDDQTMMGDGFV